MHVKTYTPKIQAPARGSSSTTAAVTPPSPCARRAKNWSWSTPTPKPSPVDYDTNDQLILEPLTVEDILSICGQVKPDAVIVHFGGQSPLYFAKVLEAAGVPIIGASPGSIDLAEDRDRFQKLLARIGLKQPDNEIAAGYVLVRHIAERIDYPVLDRPSYVLGGRAMVTVCDEPSLQKYVMRAVQAVPDPPILIDKCLEDATEVDVDALSDGRRAA